jgi:mycothiol synthase
MENVAINPAPPNLPDLNWRSISRADRATLVELAGTCHLADGGLAFLIEPDALMSRYFPNALGAAIGAFTTDERLAACATVHIAGDAVPPRATIVGQVRPGLRSRGIGTYLMRWSQFQAQALTAGAVANQLALQIRTESLTDPADRLYRAWGFEHVFEELVMRQDLRLPLPDRALERDITIATWQPELAEQFFQAYHASFRDRPGFPGWSAAEWIAWVAEDDLVPEWSLLACRGGAPLGFLIGSADLTSDPPGGYVVQVGVVPEVRRRGLASALMVEAMRRMQANGATSALLTVNINNPGAIQAYTRLGFITIGRRARYERAAQ